MHLRNNHIEKQREKNTKQKPNITERLGLYLIHEVKKCNGHLFLFFFSLVSFFLRTKHDQIEKEKPETKRKTRHETDRFKRLGKLRIQNPEKPKKKTNSEKQS